MDNILQEIFTLDSKTDPYTRQYATDSSGRRWVTKDLAESEIAKSEAEVAELRKRLAEAAELRAMEDYDRARACVNLCAGSSDSAIKDINDALRAYSMTLDQYFLRSDSETQWMLRLLKEGKELLDSAMQQRDELKAELLSLVRDIQCSSARQFITTKRLEKSINKAQGVQL